MGLNPIATEVRTVWFTGLSGAGKSTLAEALRLKLLAQGRQVVVLDGDVVRKGVSNDLGFDAASRTENLRRVACIAKLLNEQGIFVICATISPLESDRDSASTIIGSDAYAEIYVSTPLAVCEQRDPKGLYRLARSGKIENFTGISAPYEEPLESSMVVNTAETSLGDSVQNIIEALRLL